MKRLATIDATGQYRYSLQRIWQPAAPRIGFVMLNPSRADGTVEDPTLRRCIQFARQWGYGALEVVNLFAYRTPKPALLLQVPDPIGPDNDQYLLTLAARVERIVLAWGNGGQLYHRDRQVLPQFAQTGIACCLGLTKLGQPLHPLYLPSTIVPMPYPPRPAGWPQPRKSR